MSTKKTKWTIFNILKIRKKKIRKKKIRPVRNRHLESRIHFVFSSQADLAEKLGVDRAYINRIVLGKELQVSQQQKERFAKALKCEVSDIFPNGDPGQQ